MAPGFEALCDEIIETGRVTDAHDLVRQVDELQLTIDMGLAVTTRDLSELQFQALIVYRMRRNELQKRRAEESAAQAAALARRSPI